MCATQRLGHNWLQLVRYRKMLLWLMVTFPRERSSRSATGQCPLYFVTPNRAGRSRLNVINGRKSYSLCPNCARLYSRKQKLSQTLLHFWERIEETIACFLGDSIRRKQGEKLWGCTMCDPVTQSFSFSSLWKKV